MSVVPVSMAAIAALPVATFKLLPWAVMAIMHHDKLKFANR